MVADQGEKPTKVRCTACRTWHEPDQHLEPVETPEVLTGQVPVSGNPAKKHACGCEDEHA